jgi:cytoskeletal protein CcmA (bactofilin family)
LSRHRGGRGLRAAEPRIDREEPPPLYPVSLAGQAFEEYRAMLAGHSGRALDLQALEVTSDDGATLEIALDARRTLLVPEGACIVGEVSAEALCVLGEIRGEVNVGPGPVVVAATGRIDGRLTASGPAFVAGHVGGRAQDAAHAAVRCGAGLDIACTGRVVGDVACSELRVRRGGSVEGQVSIQPA